MSPEKIADLRVKHLEMLQAVIHRLANQGSGVKNFCITSVAAIIGVAFAQRLQGLVIAAIVVVVVFACLDARYLQTERRFRRLFDVVRKESGDSLPSFSLELSLAPHQSYWRALFSWSVFPLYVTLMSLAVTAFIGIPFVNR